MARPATVRLNPGRPDERVNSLALFRSRASSRRGFSLETPVGGGLGSPIERAPERVLNDVRNGYVISRESAGNLSRRC
jgi:N-methylhydantoinase B